MWGKTFWKKFFPTPLFNNFYTRKTDKAKCRFEVTIRLYAYRNFISPNPHIHCQAFPSEVF